MIKLSKDDTYILATVFPTLVVLVHISAFFMVIFLGDIFIVLVYLAFAFVHFRITRVLRFYKLQELFLDPVSNNLVFQDLGGKKTIISKKDIQQVKTHFGITDITIKNEYPEKKCFAGYYPRTVYPDRVKLSVYLTTYG